MSSVPKKILITFARSFLTLELARMLHANGHWVCVADSMKYHVSRFSNAVAKSFEVPSPRFNPEAYVAALIEIVRREKIDLLIPIYEEITYLSQAKDHFPASCEIFCPTFETYHQLQHKWLFQCKLAEMGIPHPKTILIQHQKELQTLKINTPLALKACHSRGSMQIKKVLPGQPLPELQVESYNPWVAQEWIEGEKFCTYSICHAGKILAHSVYPVRYAIEGNSCITFKAINHAPIYKWVTDFVRQINLTGQIAFDFIEAADKKLYPIECNPRATSGLLLFRNADRIDHALLAINSIPIFPKIGTRKQIATGMLLYGWKAQALPNNCFSQFLRELFTTHDVILRLKDLKPFLFEPLVFASIWSNSLKYGVSVPSAYTYDHDWNGEKSYSFGTTYCVAQK